ncbi:MAG: hypothetical protein JSR54_10425 [Proteobacteria bacterium]|nr:hypothetical protein [Pseudomonadota bacterium]
MTLPERYRAELARHGYAADAAQLAAVARLEELRLRLARAARRDQALGQRARGGGLAGEARVDLQQGRHGSSGSSGEDTNLYPQIRSSMAYIWPS